MEHVKRARGTVAAQAGPNPRVVTDAAALGNVLNIAQSAASHCAYAVKAARLHLVLVFSVIDSGSISLLEDDNVYKSGMIRVLRPEKGRPELSR